MANQVKKTLLLPKELVEEFDKRHPSYGAFTWFVRRSLENYVKLNEVDAEELNRLAVRELQNDL